MTLLIKGYTTKKQLRASVGAALHYEETSLFGAEYQRDGSFPVIHRPHFGGKGREFGAIVTMVNGKIAGVK